MISWRLATRCSRRRARSIRPRRPCPSTRSRRRGRTAPPLSATCTPAARGPSGSALQRPRWAGRRRRIRRHHAGARRVHDRGRPPRSDGTGLSPVRRRPPGRPAPLFRAAALLGLAVPAGLTAQRPALADGTLPPTTLLYQNFPNPFPAGGRDSTCIWFDLAEGGPVTLAILDLRGGPVRRFIPGPDFGDVLSAR